MKNRFNAIDVAAIVQELRNTVVEKRLANVYDLNAKTYLLKFSGGGKGKGLLLVEAGIKIHLTTHDWPKPDLPNGFSMKLRKHLRGSKLFQVDMLTSGTCLERILDLDFGKYRLIIELYDHGNILLTTLDYVVIYALRPRPAAGQPYPVPKPDSGTGNLSDILEKELSSITKDGISCEIKDQLRRWLSKVLGKRFGGATVLLEHALALNNLDGKKAMRECFQIYGDKNTFLPRLTAAVEKSESIVVSLINMSKPVSGDNSNLTSLPLSPRITLSSVGKNTVPDEYVPYVFSHLKSDPDFVKLFDSFSECVDEFYWRQEDAKFQLKKAQERDAALKRVENVRRDHDVRIRQLQEEADNASLAASILEQNQAVVEKAISTVRTAVSADLSQSDIEQMLLEARLLGDPTASVIYKLEVSKGIVKLRFGNSVIAVEIGLTAVLNGEKLWSKRRTALEKLSKTIAAAQVAVKNAERSVGSVVSKSLGEQDERSRNARLSRKPFWFEQFAWFVSSEGRLVIAGKDHQQNETIVRRYMAVSDIFVHCELHGAGVIVIKTGLDSAKLSGAEKIPPPPSTLREAAIYSVARSVAWQEGTPAHAFWVWGAQVSKTPQTGEFVTPGAFIIRGKRNLLPLEPLVLGLGVVFVAAPNLDDDAEEKPETDSSDDEDKQKPAEPNVTTDISKSSEKQDDTKGDQDTSTKEEITKEEEDEDIWANVGAKVDEEVIMISTAKSNATKKQQRQQQIKKTEQKIEPVIERAASAGNQSKPNQTTRGQKGKLKKIKNKYGDQDEEERNARMALLQSAGNKSGQKGKKNKKNAPASAPPVRRDFPERPKREFQPKKQEQPAALPFDEFFEETEGDARHRLNKQTHQIDNALPRFVADPMKKLPLVRIFTVESDGTFINRETIANRPVVYALPVCAPYPSLSRCSFRVKIIPGKTKRGKVARASVEAWQRQLSSEKQQRSGADNSNSSNEQKLQQLMAVRSLIKAVPDDEWSKNMPLSCKLMLSGAAQAAAAEKARKKSLAKKQKQAAALASAS